MLTECKSWNSHISSIHPSINNINLLKNILNIDFEHLYKVQSLEASSAACLPLHTLISEWKLIKIKLYIVHGTIVQVVSLNTEQPIFFVEIFSHDIDLAPARISASINVH